MTPLRIEVVVGPDGRPEPASAYFLGGSYSNTYSLKQVVPRLRFTPGVHAGRPARMRARMVIADTGRSALQRTPRITTAAFLTNRWEVEDALRRAYPRALRRARIAGRVILDITIDESGHPDVTASRVVESTNDELSQAALRVVPVMTFSPAVLDDGRTTRTTLRMPFDFTP